ncbi:hypothetical protein JCM11641_001794 [Rhodosporidiobolus odoratus]
MLARDFIEDSLYNPNYGYFATKVEIFDPDRAGGDDMAAERTEGFDFTSFRSTTDFENEVARRYMVFEGRGSSGEEPAAGEKAGRQVWHTPTELFKPWYARSLARYIAHAYLNPTARASPSAQHYGYPYSDLVIYEIGAGNGTLMGDILDYLATHEPAVYARTKYRIIEISERLSELQKQRVAPGVSADGGGDDVVRELAEMRKRGHEGKVEVVRKSIFEWDKVVEDECFFVAMEVLDNLPHDVIRYDLDTLQPLECTVAIDTTGDFTELFSPVNDPLLARYLSLRAHLTPHTPNLPPSRVVHPLLSRFPLLRQAYTSLPFAANLSKPEFVPTRQLELLEILRDYFPRHRVVMADFSELGEAVEGECGPVVQTRYAGETVPCTTYLVQQGFFDIFFPTNFHTMAELYSAVMSRSSPSQPHDGLFSHPAANRNSHSSITSTISSSPSPLSPTFFSPRSGPKRRELRIVDHASFLEEWAEVEMTRTKDGSNPLLDSYANAKFALS